MSFDVAAGAYGRFMGRYSEPLADALMAELPADTSGPVLDVGCGPGALTSRLVDRWGAHRVAAIDPSGSFVDSVRHRLPGVDARAGRAEALPWPDATFTVTAAALVVHFLTDPVGGLQEMGRVTVPGGTVAVTVWDQAGHRGPVAVTVWDQAGHRGPVAPFWRAVRDLHADVPDESERAGTGRGQLAALAQDAGLTVRRNAELTVAVPWSSFDQWWSTYTLGVGPAGAYLAGLSPAEQDLVRSRAAALLPAGSFVIEATAWCVVAEP